MYLTKECAKKIARDYIAKLAESVSKEYRDLTHCNLLEQHQKIAIQNAIDEELKNMKTVKGKFGKLSTLVEVYLTERHSS